MADRNDAAVMAEVIRKRAQPPPVEQPSLVEKVHAMLPDWLSARSAVLKKRARLQRLDNETKDD